MTLSNLSRMAFVAALLLLVSPAFANAGGPDVTIDYITSTDDPQRGDFVFVRALATNNEASPVRTRVYMEVDYPNGADRTYSVLSFNFPANSSFQVQNVKRMKIPVPANAPAGTYDVTLYVANDLANGGQVYDTDTFQFTLPPAPLNRGGTPVPDVTIDYITSTDDPQRDDFVFVRALATNNEASPVRTRVYMEVDYPNGADRTYSVLSFNFPANSSFQVQNIKRMKIPVPANAPAGTYDVRIYVANDLANGGEIYDVDTFQFTLDPIITKGAELAGTPDAGPNPFTTSTTIRYELTNDSEVDLRVFDVRGREVAALVSGTQTSGVHSALFSGDDLPSGVYVWRLAVDGAVTSGRVTLAR